MICIVSWGCSSEPAQKKSEEQFIKAAKTKPAKTAGLLVRKYADVLPADAVAIGVFDFKAIGQPLLEQVLAPSGYPEQKSNLEELKRELGKVLRAQLGVDLIAASHVIVAVGPKTTMMVVDGLELEGVNVQTSKVGAREVLEIKDRSVPNASEDGAWSVMLRPRKALVVFMDKGGLEAFAKGIPSLKDSPEQMARFAPRFGEPLGYGQVHVNLQDPLWAGIRESFGKEFGLRFPQEVQLSVVEDEIHMTLKGEQDDLEMLRKRLVALYREVLVTAMKRELMNQEGLSVAGTQVIYLLAHHGAQAYEPYLTKPQVQDGTLTYTFPLSVYYTPLFAVMPAMTIPMFATSVKKSKFSEAEGVLSELATKAKLIYVSSGARACAFPPSTPPSSAQIPRYGKYQPVQLGKAWNMYAGTSLDNMKRAYFSYEIENHTSYVIIRAVADFNAGGPMHTSEVVVQAMPSKGGCDAKIRPISTRNHLE